MNIFLKSNNRKNLSIYLLVIGITWLVVILLSMFWNMYVIGNQKKELISAAKVIARDERTSDDFNLVISQREKFSDYILDNLKPGSNSNHLIASLNGSELPIAKTEFCSDSGKIKSVKCIVCHVNVQEGNNVTQTTLSIPIASFDQSFSRQRATIIIFHGFLLLIGFVSIGTGIKLYEKNIKINSVFQSLMHRLNNPLTLYTAAKIIAEEIYPIFQYDAFSLDIIDEDRKLLMGIYNLDTDLGEEKPTERKSFSHPLSKVINKEVVFEGKSKLINRGKSDKKENFYKFGNASRPSKSLMFLPLKYKNKVVGILSLQSYTHEKYSKKEMELLNDFSALIGGPILGFHLKERLSENEFLLKEAQKVSNVGTFSFEVRECVWESSEGLDEILGIEPNYPKTYSAWLRLLYSQDRKMLRDYFKTTFNKKNLFYKKDFRIKRVSDGEIRWVRGFAKLKVNKLGKLDRLIGTVQDITKQKEFEDNLKKAKESAEKSDKMKSIFLAQMSHEIRTPINAILSLSSLIKEDVHDKVDEDVKSSFYLIDKAGTRIVRTVELLLNLAEMQAGTYKIIEREVDIYNDIIKNVILDYKSQADVKEIKIIEDIKVSDTTKLTDQFAVEQIIKQLFDNAMKYTNQGKITIKLFKEEDTLIFEISDTGIGISEKYLEQLFEPFSQEEMGYTRKYEGNGIGLSLVKDYCDVINAKISCQSKKDEGTTFTVKFD